MFVILLILSKLVTCRFRWNGILTSDVLALQEEVVGGPAPCALMEYPQKNSFKEGSEKTPVNIHVMIVAENYLYRRGLEEIVSKSNNESYVVLNSIQFDDLSEQYLDGVERDAEVPILVLLSSSGNDPNSIQLINVVKSRLTRSSVIVLAQKSNPNHLYQCISHGADGYLLSHATEDTLLDTMRLVRNGQSVFPGQIGNLIDGPRSIERTSRDTESNAGIIDARLFTDRETQILRCLTSGMSNKAISRALEMADATVKLTVRNILVKIRVTNRVQAAVWATKNGFTYTEPLPSRQTVNTQNQSATHTDTVIDRHAAGNSDVHVAPLNSGTVG